MSQHDEMGDSRNKDEIIKEQAAEIESLKAENERLKVASAAAQQKKSGTDALTGLPTRGSFEEEVDRTLREVERARGCYGLLVIDLNDFKPINDQFGHLAGDIALQHVANTLQVGLRGRDFLTRVDDDFLGHFLARFGGDEFVVIARVQDEGELPLMVDRLRGLVGEKPADVDGHTVSLSISVGYTLIEKGDSLESAFRRSDAAMYRDKQDQKKQRS